ncbi:UvrD-helicase domain-containing protein [Gordonia sp. UBA7860]|uniref:UvrD-helicase domain-containing protein n=1 Tax=Gordonia sp. UBA7860 TaxID=1946579 RepID=UPI00257A7FBA|nr:ATP-dependent helicase [Gordonia sp. UBA7860]
MVEPTVRQAEIRDHEGLSLLVVAPAGCGKTEALGLRAKGLIARGNAVAPRRILVTTFSNRARDNARDRLQSYLTPQEMRDLVTVSNFHGLAARIFRAHANVIGLDPTMIAPESDWIAEQCRARGLSFLASTDVQTFLRVAKQEPRDDAEVDAELVRVGNRVALEIERQRIAEGRLTYDDLPRLAEIILANDQVAGLYRNHFAAVIVDEFQDLTPQQLRIVNRIGYGKTTYAGDLAQGIYSFAGAMPNQVHAALQAECVDTIEFSESHRSSPAVLAMVNSLNGVTGGQILTAAKPASWPGGGLAGGVGFSDVGSEAEWIVALCERILKNAPGQRIGVVARTKPRRRFADERVEASGLPYYRWEDGVLDTDTARAMKAMLTRLSVVEFNAAADQLEFLRTAAGLDSIQDSNDRTSMADAINWCYDLLQDGVTAAAIRGRIRVGDDSTLLSLPGVHLLTGHAGKGQQFDWIVVLGLEEDTLPDFRQKDTAEALAEEARILAVMISRARHGVILTGSKTVPIKSGAIRNRVASRFWKLLGSGGWIKQDAIDAWFDAADWDAIARR